MIAAYHKGETALPLVTVLVLVAHVRSGTSYASCTRGPTVNVAATTDGVPVDGRARQLRRADARHRQGTAHRRRVHARRGHRDGGQRHRRVLLRQPYRQQAVRARDQPQQDRSKASSAARCRRSSCACSILKYHPGRVPVGRRQGALARLRRVDRGAARRSGRVDDQARPRHQGHGHRCCPATAACSTASTHCCSCCRRRTTWSASCTSKGP